MNDDHRSWDAEWADRQNIPEWPMWLLIFAAAFIVFIITHIL